VDGSAEASRMLRRLRAAAADAAMVVLRSGMSGTVSLQPEDVGDRSTLDLDDLDRRTMSLTLQLAVERHRVARLLAGATAPGSVDDRLSGGGGFREPVTGLMTGELLLEGIDRMIADAVRFGRPLTVAVAHVDGADEVRRTLGPAALDRVLVQVTRLMLADLRTCDLIGRLDAGQLMMVLSATSIQSAMLPLRRLQQAVRSAAPPSPVSPPTTLSVGLCGLQGLMSVDEMVYDAIRAARKAAAGGGDVVAIADRCSTSLI
jgi:diguanylate cyclase (GGDEF)-like protein